MLINKHVLILIPLILSGFTHLWNPAQFPSFHVDEGVYIRRALFSMNGLGLLDPDSSFDHPQDTTSAYDHPFFGQIFLAGIFKILDFPTLLKPLSDTSSVESLFAVPRLIMGAIALADTFLIYKISERRFNATVALFSSLLFAVMPSTWFTRRVVLDSIMLPFILTAILLVLEIKIRPKFINILSLLSGISLGLAIFTKIPSFTMIPLLVFLIFQIVERKSILSKNSLKKVSLFLIPVVLIPLIWPTYALLSGDINQWFEGVIWQATSRQSDDKTLFDVLNSFMRTDPVLLILGLIGIVYLTLRREFIGVIWILPYFIFLYLVGWVNHFHLILILPILCIAVAKIIYDLPFIVRIARKKTRIARKKTVISSGIMVAIVLFGLTSTSILISTDLSYVHIKTASYIGNEIILQNSNMNDNNKTTPSGDKITVITGPIYSWIYKYAFDNEHTFSHIRDTQPIKTEKIILLVDPLYNRLTLRSEAENETQLARLSNIYNNTEIAALIAKLPATYSKKNYPFTGIDSADSGLGTSEIRKNY